MPSQLPNIGIDGCKHGWICVYRVQGADSLQGKLIEHIAELDCSRFACIAIDTPIGLPDAGSRACDLEARRMLGKRGVTVFPAPLRAVLNAPDWQTACGIREAIEGKRISLQTWNIVPKIREVDSFLQNNQMARSSIYEVHPEVSFCFMNNGNPLLTKKNRAAGKRERATMIDSYFGKGSFMCLRESLLPRNGWGEDDLLDACVALWTAERIESGNALTLPEIPSTDSTGLPMRIVY